VRLEPKIQFVSKPGYDGPMRKHWNRFVSASRVVASIAGAALLGAHPLARGDALSVVNALRADGCTPTAVAPVQRSSVLDAAARELARKTSRGGARSCRVSSRILRVVNAARARRGRRRLLADRYWGRSAPRVHRARAHQSGDETWIVLAVRTDIPFSDVGIPRPSQAACSSQAARAEPQCGRDSFGAASPLTASTTLAAAAALHAQDMAEHRKLDHTGSDGSASGDRITRAGYVWRAAGENIASGQSDAETVVAGWISSPGHCATLMAPYFTETGVAFALAPNEDPPIYWVQVFAAPR
jgi:uncharacterized protein YkwD